MSPDAAKPTTPLEIVDTEGAARFLALSESTLEKKRCTGGGPPFLKYGKTVRYRVSDLQAWAGAHVVASTSQQPQAVIDRAHAGKRRRGGGGAKRAA